MRKWCSFALTLATASGGLAFLVYAAPATPAQAQQQAAAAPKQLAPHQDYAGTASCLECHADMGDTLTGTPHGTAAFSELSDKGCETCHGPAKGHADNPDDTALLPSITKLDARQQAKTCQQCHSGGEQFYWQDGVHEHRGLSCVTCHSVHHPKSAEGQLQAVSTQEQCFNCHRDVRAETWKRSHHPIREGELTCTDCHNPHGSNTDKMIRAASVNDQCYTCHTEKRGPFLWEHPPVRENCLNCHTPHGSNHFKLQKTSVPFICQQCHSNTRHPGTMYDALTLADSPTPSSREFARACLNCHAAIHGSNHPASPYLGH
jgi:DmsE family decaheme c-type cytochrome